CHEAVHPEQFFELCIQAACSCASDARDCICPVLSHYAHACAQRGHVLDWRNDVPQCGVSCENGQSYQSCASVCDSSCSLIGRNVSCASRCVEGCACGPGHSADSRGHCVPVSECGCLFRGHEFPAGFKQRRHSEHCICASGHWSCTQQQCAGTCALWGDSHVTTFDGAALDFSGVCDYVLVKGGLPNNQSISVVVQNVPCGRRASCAKAVTITAGTIFGRVCTEVLVLTEGHPVPPLEPDSRMQVQTLGLFVGVDVFGGLAVFWDKHARVYVIAGPAWSDKLQGLCGNFNGDGTDDFRAPSGGPTLPDAIEFVNSWKLHPHCAPAVAQQDGCLAQPDRKKWAASQCQILREDLFRPCHSEVDVQPFYDRCVSDTCACDTGGDCECLCTAIGAYAHQCASRGVRVLWRSQELCPLQCDTCDEYSACVSFCKPPTCEHPVVHDACKVSPPLCLEGCTPALCPNGMVHRTATDRTCVPVQDCGVPPETACSIGGLHFKEGQRVATSNACQSWYVGLIFRVPISMPGGICFSFCLRGEVRCVGKPCPIEVQVCVQTGWSDWESMNSPEYQVFENSSFRLFFFFFSLQAHGDHCPVEHMVAVECRTVGSKTPWNETGESVLCSPHTGLRCLREDQDDRELCSDYEMRVFCRCPEEEKRIVFCQKPARESAPTIRSTRYTFTVKLQNANVPIGPTAASAATPPAARSCTSSSPRASARPKRAAACPAASPPTASRTSSTSTKTPAYLCSTVPACCPNEKPPLRLVAFCFPLCDMSLCTAYTPEPEGGCWTPWFSADSPEGPGDFEDLRPMQAHGKVCFQPAAINCRTVAAERFVSSLFLFVTLHVGNTDWSQSGQKVTCAVDRGLQCWNSENSPEQCQDYEVRFYCPCVESVYSSGVCTCLFVEVTYLRFGCGLTWKSPGLAFCTDSPKCKHHHSSLLEDIKQKGKNATSSENTDSCVLHQVLQLFFETVLLLSPFLCPHRIRCFSVCTQQCHSKIGNNHAKMTSFLELESVSSRRVCTCFFVEDTHPRFGFTWNSPAFVFWTESPKCKHHYKTPTPVPWTPVPEPHCEHGWSSWLNGHSLDALGDLETLQSARDTGLLQCPSVTAMECREADSQVPWDQSGLVGVQCDLTTGLVCRNKGQPKGRSCADFEVRFFCDCGAETPPPPPTLPPATPTPAILVETTPPACSFWSDWVDENHPGLEGQDGEREPGLNLRPELGDFCQEFIRLIDGPEPLKDSLLKASSSRDSKSGPQASRFSSDKQKPFALIRDKLYGSWVPHLNDKEFIEAELVRPQTVYGVETRGDSQLGAWVTSFTVMFSQDGVAYGQLSNTDGSPKVFSGNHDAQSKNRQLFEHPFQAKFIRLVPKSWEGRIALKWDLLGCSHVSLHPFLPDGKKPFRCPVCREPMGLQSGLIGDNQMEASSYRDEEHAAHYGRVEQRGWVAGVADKQQYLQVDFEDSRNLTAVVTQGRPEIPQWVKSFIVQTSNNGKRWNTIKDKQGGEMVFSGNFDSSTPVTSVFPKTVSARYIRIVPVTWKNWIALRLEVLGCEHGKYYHGLWALEESTPTPELTAVHCPEVSGENATACGQGCPVGFACDGLRCVHEADCPCVRDGKHFPVGGILETRTCQECQCQLGGRSNCLPIACPACPEGRAKILNPDCSCDCGGCPEGQRLCPTSGECVNEDLWCDGVVNCPDDEAQCEAKTPAPCPPVAKVFCGKGQTMTLQTDDQGCEHFSCGKTYLPRFVWKTLRKIYIACNFLLSSVGETSCSCTSHSRVFVNVLALRDQPHEVLLLAVAESGERPIIVPPPPSKYAVLYFANSKFNLCTFTAKGHIFPHLYASSIDASCELVGHHFSTFDGREFDYSYCHHILLQDVVGGNLTISVDRHCSLENQESCPKRVIVEHGHHRIVLDADLSATVDEDEYSAHQLQLLTKRLPDFELERVGERIHFRSRVHNLVLKLDVRGRVEIEVDSSLKGVLGGLCGFYNELVSDDLTTPAGHQVATTDEFGDSWATPGTAQDCLPLACPKDTLLQAAKICNRLKEEPLSQCQGIEDQLENCLSASCECLQRGNTTAESCACDAYLDAVTQCEKDGGEKVVESLRGWRLEYGCVPDCPPEMEWLDCGPDCQITCENFLSGDLSCATKKSCNPGCFCPPGTVLDRDHCKKADECADKVCTGYGDPMIETFDGWKFHVQSNGHFELVFDREGRFMVDAVTDSCEERATCIIGLDIKHENHVAKIRRHKQVLIDNEEYDRDQLPWTGMGVTIFAMPGKVTVVVFTGLGVQIRYNEISAAFSIHVPSKTFFNKTAGLCGNCNGKPDDDKTTKNGTVTEELVTFVCSWETHISEEECEPEKPPVPGACSEILDREVFGQCLSLVDTTKFVDQCRHDTSFSVQENTAVCSSLLEMARACYTRYMSCHDACPQSCDAERENEASSKFVKGSSKTHYHKSDCRNLKVDGCFCPDGQVFEDGDCKPKDVCDLCDDQGHKLGDVWKTDQCTSCTCKKDGKMDCQHEVCPPDPICRENQKLLRHLPHQHLCFRTLPAEDIVEECPELSLPRCERGDVTRTKTDSKGCPMYYCECDPALCPPVVWPMDLEPGQEVEMTPVGCCATLHAVCRPEKCPQPPHCAPPLELLETPGVCCRSFKCRPPEKVCPYAHKFVVVDGKEVAIEPALQNVSFYEPGQTWRDGLCSNCSCDESETDLMARCNLERCYESAELPDDKDYFLSIVDVPNRCCPALVRLFCKDEYGNIREPGDEWQSRDDQCKSHICEQTALGEVHKVERSIICPKCPENAQALPLGPGECCPRCQIVACEEAGVMHPVGSHWNSSSHLCYRAECVQAGDTARIVYTSPSC
ncbi:hemolectin, putative, partial [Ixodes scapularis]